MTQRCERGWGRSSGATLGEERDNGEKKVERIKPGTDVSGEGGEEEARVRKTELPRFLPFWDIGQEMSS